MARAVALVKRKALFAAVEAGDITALDAHFVDVAVRVEVEETERYIVENDPNSVSFLLPSPAGGAVSPWYQEPEPDTEFVIKNVFTVAVDAGQFDVLQWFFSSPRIAFMQATVVLLWPSTARAVLNTRNTDMLELLLNVGGALLFLEDNFTTLLTELISALWAQRSEMIDIVLSHGGEITADAVFGEYDGSGVSIFQFMADQGAFIVGAEIPEDCSQTGEREELLRLLELGAYAGTTSKGLVIAAAHGECGIMELYLTKTFMDVDRMDNRGRSALLLVAALNRMNVFYGEDRLLSTMKMLLETGANANVKDRNDMTPLYHAVETQNTAMAEFLLQYGADPSDSLTVFSAFDAILASLDASQGGFDKAATSMLLLLLRNGVDPHTQNVQGKTIVSQLQQLEEGRAFMQANPEFF